MNKKFTILKVLSNNVVISQLDNDLYVLTGKGIGFGRKKGDIVVDDGIIEQKFIAIREDEKENYKKVLQNVSSDVVAVTEEIITLAEKRLGEELDFHVHIGLADHIDFSIKRIKEGIDIVNPFIYEIQTMYPVEFSIAEDAIDLINKMLKVKLPDSEAGFITLHIYSARVNQQVTDSLKYTRIVKEIVDFIQGKLNITIKEKSLEYARLMSHLRYALDRIDNGKVIKNVLLPAVKRQFKEEYKLSKEICKLISEKLEKPVPDDEVGYIAVHLGRLRSNT